MKFLDVAILLLLFLLLGIGFYILWLNLPGEPAEFEEYEIDVTDQTFSNGIQFYNNMRYRDRIISYSISQACDAKRTSDAKRSFNILSDKTILQFNEAKSNAEINILCSDIAPKPEEKDHFVAGEGGPSEIINSSKYAVILSGKVSLFRSNDCELPNIAIHEILHSLGFDHNENKKSIMYPVTQCDQIIDQYILDEINRLYVTDSNPDLAIEKIGANKSGRYLSFEIVIGNFGLKDAGVSKLAVSVEGQLIKEFDLEKIPIGTRKILTVENLRISRETESIKFEVVSSDKDLDEKNNVAELMAVESV